MKKSQAKAKRHIYSSGLAGCGGKAEHTATATEPLPCPYCDRIYTKATTGRLQDHIKKKHAEEEKEKATGTIPASGDDTPISSAGEGSASGETAGQRADGKAMYHVKTPKQFLQEWCHRNKRPNPKYKDVAVEGGYQCRVILPDARDSENDVIFWYRTGSPSAEAAHQQAALLGMHHVMGDRRMDRVLGEEYRERWRNLDVEAERKKAQDLARQQRQKERLRHAPKPRELQAVFMSDQNRKLVESLLRDGAGGGSDVVDERHAGDTWESTLVADVSTGYNGMQVAEQYKAVEEGEGRASAATTGDGCEDWEDLEVEAEKLNKSGGGGEETREGGEGQWEGKDALRERLLGLGFLEKDVGRALAGERRRSLQAALDWLMVNVEESALPTKFAPTSSGASVRVLLGASGSPAFSAAVDRLVEVGYTRQESQAAVVRGGGDADAALCFAFASLGHGSASQSPTSQGQQQEEEGGDAELCLAEEMMELRADEMLALEAIYGNDLQRPSTSSLFITLPRPDGLPSALTFQVVVVETSKYPNELPAFAFSGHQHQLPPPFVRALTVRVAAQARTLLGSCMLYQLASYACDDAGPLYHSFLARQSSALQPPPGVRERGGMLREEREVTLHAGAGAGAGAGAEGASSTGKGQSEAVGASQKDSGQGRSVRSADVKTYQRGRPRGRTSDAVGSDSEAALQQQLRQLREAPQHQKVRSMRERLPAFAARDTVVACIRQSMVTVVSGQTGCGKSTQVPQYILEDMIERGEGTACNIVCTQPRRISAIGLAERVSHERGESAGGIVGYTIRLESRRSARTRLLFCTTGVLLRRLLSDQELSDVSHVIVDEVHERSLDSDLLLLLLRNLLRNQLNGPDGKRVRVVLMSATGEASLYARYFESALRLPSSLMSIPGFTHPVRELYLEDALELTGTHIARKSRYAAKAKATPLPAPPAPTAAGPGPVPGTRSLLPLPPALTTANDIPEQWDDDDDNDLPSLEVPSAAAEPDETLSTEYSERTLQSLSIVDEGVLNYDLAEAVIAAIVEDEHDPNRSRFSPAEAVSLPPPSNKGTASSAPPCAVLVFLPGMPEIRRLQSQLQQSRRLADAKRGLQLQVLPLHGSLSGDEQRRVFVQPPRGTLKIVLATNVAETSITIDDVVYVIDTGRHKEMRYDQAKGLACLDDTWVSKASANQRRGRAGRVQPGCCIRLFSRRQFQSLADHQSPEILRVPLESLCLQVKAMNLPGRVADILGQALTPPDPQAVVASIRSLRELSALDSTEALTPLGQHLAHMPVDPRVGKMLLFACLLRCLNPVATVAAALSGRSLFLSPPDRRQEASAARQRLSGGSKSDHMAVVAAYKGWMKARQQGRHAEFQFCDAHFLSRDGLLAVEGTRMEYIRVLVDLGFAHSDSLSRSSLAAESESATSMDANAGSARIVKAVLCAGFYPNVVRIQHPETRYAETEGGTMAKDAAAHELRFFTRLDGRVFVHPGSVNFPVGRYESPYLVYSEKVRTSKVFVRESSMIPAYALLLFGGEIGVQHERQIITVDGWLQFEAPARIAVLIRELRSKVDALFGEKIKDPSLDISSSPVVAALTKLLSADGF